MQMANNRETDTIAVIDVTGEQVDEIHLKDTIIPIPTKRGGFSHNGLYYKGAGIVYRNHLGCDQIPDGCTEQSVPVAKIIGKTRLIYENLILCYPNLVGKHGIFLFPHQPIFSDCEGGCGKKEQRLVENLKNFDRSAIEELVDIIPTGVENHMIYCYKLREVKGCVKDTVELLRYVLQNNWNTAWDKNLWEDIEAYGYVRDAADWFRSDRLEHKLGTVYALLNSLYRADMRIYARLLLEIFGTYHFDKKMILYYSARIVQRFCKEYEALTEAVEGQHIRQLYMWLTAGKACCHLEDETKWNWVREYHERRMETWDL